MKTAETASNAGHSPTLDTLLMIEKKIRDAELPQKRTELWEALPRRMMYQTFKIALAYLEGSGKILIDKEDRVVWIGADSAILDELYERAVKVR